MQAAIALSTQRESPISDRANQGPMPGDSMAALDHVGAVITLQRDETLFLGGDKADCYFKVLKGAVRSSKVLDDGRRHIGDFYLIGDFIGLDAGETHGAAAEAIGETVLIRYARRNVDALAAEQPRVAQSLIELMRARLIAARERMVLLGHMTAMERIAAFLLGLAGRAEDGRIDLPMTRTDIGDYLGLTMETVSRAFSKLKTGGIIVQRSMHELALVDRAALLALIQR